MPISLQDAHTGYIHVLLCGLLKNWNPGQSDHGFSQRLLESFFSLRGGSGLHKISTRLKLWQLMSETKWVKIKAIIWTKTGSPGGPCYKRFLGGQNMGLMKANVKPRGRRMTGGIPPKADWLSEYSLVLQQHSTVNPSGCYSHHQL